MSESDLPTVYSIDAGAVPADQFSGEVKGDGSIALTYTGARPLRIAKIVYPDGTTLGPAPFPVAPGAVINLPSKAQAPVASRLGKIKATGEVWRNGKLVTD